MERVHRTAGILAIGDELVLGQKLDTNSHWLSDRLVGLGIRTLEHATVDDDVEAIAESIRRLSASSDLVICTGGLGPTADDRTREGLAAALGDELLEDEALLADLVAWFDGRGRAMPAANRVQALRPSVARGLANPKGTAPGLHAVLAPGVDVFCLPGPPREMRPMFDADVVRALRSEDGTVIRTAFLHTFGKGESDVAQMLGPLMDRDRNPLVGTTASGGVVTCRIRYEGAFGPAEDVMRQALEAVSKRLGDVVFAVGDQTMPGVCLDLLRANKQILCTIESCTGGMVGQMLTDVAGSSDAYLGGWVTYTNEMKHAEVGVPMEIFERVGAVSAECAAAMARGGLERSGADHALAITGIAGPGGGSDDKPVGTVWIGRVSSDGTSDIRRFWFRGERSDIRERSAMTAFAMLRLQLVGVEMSLPMQVAKMPGR